MAILIETTEEGLQSQEENFVAKIDKYVIPLKLDADSVAEIKENVKVMKYINVVAIMLKTGSQSADVLKNASL